MIRRSTMSAGVFISFLLYAGILVILYWYMYNIFVNFRKVCVQYVILMPLYKVLLIYICKYTKKFGIFN